MGFEINLLLLTPRRVEKVTLWNVETVLNLGRISARINDPNFHNKNARGRAALYLFDLFYGGLMAHVNSSGKKCIAPKFLIPEEGTIFPTKKKQQFIQPFSGRGRYGLIPSCSEMERHNDAPIKRDGHQSTGDIVFAFPLVWVPCHLLAEWILEQEKKATSAALLKPEDEEGNLCFRRWKSAITQAAKGDLKALFIFEDIEDPRVF